MLPDISYEQQLLQEVRGLDQDDLEKVLRMIHFMKNEILQVKHARQETRINQYAGMLKDLSEDETEFFTAAIQRTSMFGKRDMQP